MIRFLLVCVLFEIGRLNAATPDSFDLNVLMPNVAPKIKDTYLCYKFKLDAEKPTYITEFQPNSTQSIAHHMLLFGCETPMEEEVWNCGEMAMASGEKKEGDYKYGPVCRGKQSIIYAWALDAPKLVLPEDVAFKVGGNTDIKYLILQVHYASVDTFIDGGTDNSGIKMIAQSEPVKYTAGVYLLETAGYIKPHTTEKFEAACEMNENVIIHPFAYRTHAHKLGVVNSAYVVKQHGRVQSWYELGRRSPQLPQMFFPISNDIKIRKGDVLAARCTMTNDLDRTVSIGATTNDEMCNFYLMYYVKGNEILENNICFTSGPPNWYFKDFTSTDGYKLKESSIPEDASDVPEEQLAELKNNPHHGMHHAEATNSNSMHEPGMQDEIENSEKHEMEHNMKHKHGHEDGSSEESNEENVDDYEISLDDLARQDELNKLLEKYLN